MVQKKEEGRKNKRDRRKWREQRRGGERERECGVVGPEKDLDRAFLLSFRV
jgi:hypothetical protein